jgi:putative ABC transport system permease protein
LRLGDTVREVYLNLSRRRLRTFLTVLGVAIGSLTVTVVISLASGLRGFIQLQTSALADPKALQVFAGKSLPIDAVLSGTLGRLGRPPREIKPESGVMNPGAFNLRFFTPEEVERIRKIPHVVRVSPGTMVFVNSLQLEGDGRKFEVICIPEDEGFNMELASGTGFTKNSEYEVILTQQYLQSFGVADPKQVIGKNVLLEVSRCPLTIGANNLPLLPGDPTRKLFTARILGVTKPTLLSTAVFSSEKLAVDIARFFLSDEELHTPGRFGLVVNVVADREKNVRGIKKAIEEFGMSAITVEERLGFLRTMFSVIEVGLSVFGAIALFVAGLGIANTQIMSIYERRREIGVMKALGATNAQVRFLFACEALFIGFSGGVVGFCAASVVGFTGNAVARATIAKYWGECSFFAFPWHLPIGIIFFCSFIGLLAGVYPASRAAKLDPIEALRSQ